MDPQIALRRLERRFRVLCCVVLLMGVGGGLLLKVDPNRWTATGVG